MTSNADGLAGERTPPEWASSFLATAMAAAHDSPPVSSWGDAGRTWTRLGNGIVCIEPETPVESSIVVSAAIHGNETAPAEMLDAIVHDVAVGRLVSAARLLVIIGNPPAVVLGRRFVEENLNRLFSGVHLDRDHAEARRAEELERAVADFFDVAPAHHRRLHYELHTAIRGSELERFVIEPHGQTLAEDQLDLLRRGDVHAVLLADRGATTFSYYSSNTCGAESMTVELGQVSPLGSNDPHDLAAIDSVLRAVLSAGPLPPAVSNPIVFAVEHELLRTSADEFEFHLDEAVPNFTLLHDGQQLISDPDGGFVVRGSGRRIVFPNPDVPVGQRVGLVVAPTDAVPARPLSS